jgi:hypothetical protein
MRSRVVTVDDVDLGRMGASPPVPCHCIHSLSTVVDYDHNFVQIYLAFHRLNRG